MSIFGLCDSAALVCLTLAACLLARSRPTWRPVAAGLVAVALLEALDVVALWCGWVRPRVFAAVALPGVLAAMAWATSRTRERLSLAWLLYPAFALFIAVRYPHLAAAAYLAALTWPRRVAAALTLLAWAGAPRTPSRPRMVALLFAGGNAVGLAGAWLLGEPARDWALAQALTAGEYAIAGMVMAREWGAGRDRS